VGHHGVEKLQTNKYVSLQLISRMIKTHRENDLFIGSFIWNKIKMLQVVQT
jgi:hypothetical protein